MRVARERGLRVFCWTVNDASEIRAAFEMEVDGVITDFPNRAVIPWYAASAASERGFQRSSESKRIILVQ